MRPLGKKVKVDLEKDEFMKKCCYCGNQKSIEFNHALIYGGRQMDEAYAITPLCSDCHRGDNGTIKKEIRDYCTLLAITRGLPKILKKYPKRDWIWEKQWLEQKVKRYVIDKKI